MRILCFFLKASVHKWERRDFGSGPNDTKPGALERGGLGASFKVRNIHINEFPVSLRLIKVINILIFFFEKTRLHAYFVIFFLKPQHRDSGSGPNDTKPSAFLSCLSIFLS